MACPCDLLYHSSSSPCQKTLRVNLRPQLRMLKQLIDQDRHIPLRQFAALSDTYRSIDCQRSDSHQPALMKSNHRHLGLTSLVCLACLAPSQPLMAQGVGQLPPLELHHIRIVGERLEGNETLPQPEQGREELDNRV